MADAEGFLDAGTLGYAPSALAAAGDDVRSGEAREYTAACCGAPPAGPPFGVAGACEESESEEEGVEGEQLPAFADAPVDEEPSVSFADLSLCGAQSAALPVRGLRAQRMPHDGSDAEATGSAGVSGDVTPRLATGSARYAVCDAPARTPPQDTAGLR
ncbi:hypothetical protein EON67_00665, partial [archaeon]